MTISRGQMNRQLYMGGGIMDVVPREQYGFGSIFKGVTKAVKGATKTVKKIASSDIGKAAITGAVLFGIPGMGAAGGLGGGLLGRASFGGAAPGVFGFGGIGGALAAGKSKFFPGLSQSDSMLNAVNKSLGGNGFGKIGKLAGLAGVTGFLTSTLGMSEEQAGEEFKRDPSKYLRLYYTNLNPPGDKKPEVYEQEVQNFISTNTSEYAEGGRIGYDSGTPDPKIPEEFLEDLKRRKIDELFQRYKRFQEDYEREKAGAQTQEAAMGGRIGYDIGGNAMTASYGYDDAMSETYNNFLDMKKNKQIPIDMDFDEFLRDVVPEMSKMQTEGRGSAAMGGRMQYALGDSASQNAMQASGIEGLPMRQNPKGVQELDLRDNGGFIPPVGIKEKEDDIPAMLSNNEFVFTADAVRGMGDGDVELGAQRMYDQMKTLEEGGRV